MHRWATVAGGVVRDSLLRKTQREGSETIIARSASTRDTLPDVAVREAWRQT